VSFVVTAALAVGLLVAVPIIAHLFRRGRATEREFPPARLVPPAQPVARQRSRLQDRVLLAARALVIASLAVLGATPLVRCSRLSLARHAGASVGLAIVLDDSLSMRAVDGGKSRWQRAVDGARELLASARNGDAVAIVLAGHPARLALAATTDLSAASRALDELRPSDRSTDLEGALGMARAALRQLPQADKRVVLLSDLAAPVTLSGTPPVWAPLPELHRQMSDCAVVTAERRDRRVTVQVACSSAAAASGRELDLVAHAKSGGALAHAALDARAGVQTLGLTLQRHAPVADAKLTGADAIAEDDAAPVTTQTAALSVAVVSDPSSPPLTTGGPSMLEQAFRALKEGIAVQPLTLAPDSAEQLRRNAAVVLDNPGGLSPETRAALGDFVDHGGVALALLGPRAQTAELGSTLEPFAQGAVHWVATHAKGVDVHSVAWLGDQAKTLGDLNATARAELDVVKMSGARVAARWDDGEPFLLERSSGRGLILTVGLPASVDLSDFSLRPGFVALLDYVVEQTKSRSGPRRSVAGNRWVFPGSSRVRVVGPRGPLELSDVPAMALPACSAAGGSCAPQKSAVPELVGRYAVNVDGRTQTRIVQVDAEEVLAKPRGSVAAAASARADHASGRVDASSAAALALLALLAGELLLRALLRRRPARGVPPRARRRAA
jgi:von Willebrand factor type A domain/Aerotolerance regulator N-terminal